MSNSAALRELRTWPPGTAVDILLAAVLIVFGIAVWADTSLFGEGGTTVLVRAVVVVSPAVLILRSRRPDIASVVLLLANVGVVASGYQVANLALVGFPTVAALSFALYSLAVSGFGGRLLIWVGVTSVIVFAAVAAVAVGPSQVGSWLSTLSDHSDYASLVMVSASASLLVGWVVRGYRTAQGQATEREVALQRVSAQETSRRVVLEERATIARDLHDSVAHHVNLMVIQAETGPDIVERGTDDVLRVFRLIGDTGRRALTDLDRTLALLRNDSEASLAPQPSLDDLHQLVENTTAQGLRVDLTIEGERRPLDAGLELAAYRIVQESLTNVIKHAGTDSAQVLLGYLPDGLSVQVIDRGQGFEPTAPPAGRAGHGLPGMRERARSNGGTLAIASAPGAGTAVSAWLPAVEPR